MVKHRGLNLRKFIASLPWDLFESYFAQLETDNKPGGWEWLNPQLAEQFLGAEENAEATASIIEDFQRINDLGGMYVPFLLKGLTAAGIEWRDKETATAPAMRLFLQDRQAFEYSWTLFLLQATPALRSEYYFPAGDLKPSPKALEQFRAHLSGWFSVNKQGSQCQSSVYREDDRLLMRIARGTTLKTYARWKNDLVAIESFRLAAEDVLIYEPARSVLGILGNTKRERERYIRAFATYVAGSENLAELALNRRIFSLEPFRQGTFSYAGNGVIRRVGLIEVGLQDSSLWKGTWTLRSANVPENLAHYNISLADVDLKRVKLQFEIQTEMETRPRIVLVDVEPPGTSDLAQKHFQTIIENYLRQQGVKLI
ncbi:MAG TPA: hypothetical protein VJB57_19945 [Dehalococcoidia bacterium]|nr:hypothetical protein [Dehalococcoidia bacterium]